jgi:hypothetical protein
MTETDPSDLCRIEHRRHGLPHRGKHRARAGMKQQRFLVAYQKLVELQIEFLHERGNPEQVRRYL